MKTIHVVDSHTGGEHTRVVISGGPDLGQGTLAERVERFRRDHDRFRAAIVNEPRGSDVMVGALLVPPTAGAATGVIFFNNVGYLGMCGHGTIGLVATLAHLGRIQPGDHEIETPVGSVVAHWHPDGRASIRNVASYRLAKDVSVVVPGVGTVVGDIAWGGNWFFLVHHHEERLNLANVDHLTEVTWRIRKALASQQITGAQGAEIDHIELFAPPEDPINHSRNFVLCPGRAYDRSPCGTGTSAKLACLVADGKLRAGEIWRQESILGSVFEGSVEEQDGHWIPTITGQAWVNAETQLILDPSDPFCWGVR